MKWPEFNQVDEATFGCQSHVEAKHFYMKLRAQRRNLEFDLTIEHLQNLLSNLPEHCPCCKIEYNLKQGTRRYPTVDRFDPDKGYLLSNVMIICYRCNNLKGGLERQQIEGSVAKVLHIQLWIDSVKREKALGGHNVQEEKGTCT